ncbi:Fc receptor-like protein 5 [Lates calcarifer]|uniref:Fc receptor-like protein 5 n=3 Tax=Lates calcarifer TaxID=8187 RepID=A0AAJ7PJ85_LATCA|nr:Fc receptor-like protein 5 [Lates calcarifer]
MGQMLFFLLEFILLNTLLYSGQTQDAVLRLEPNWSTFFTGESVTFICDMKEGKDTDWEYTINKNDQEFVPYNTHKDYTLTLSTGYSGKYQCTGRHKSSGFIKNSNIISLTISEKPKATLTPGPTTIPVGGSVTLTCSVKGSAGWKYEWYRSSGSSHTLLVRDGAINKVISVSQGGTYWCRGGRGKPVFYSYPSHDVSIEITFSNVRVSVTLQHSWPQIFTGETITVRCEIQGGGDTEWEYEWRTTSSDKPPNQHEYRIYYASSSHSGNYECRGRKKSSQQSSTKWSDSFNLTVYDNKPQPVLTVSPSWLSPGASVTLNCEVEHPSAGWRFYWYKTVPDLSHNSYIYELLPGNSRGTEQDSYIVHGQTHTAGYVCRAGRGDPVFYTRYSHSKFVWSGDLHPAASLTVNPDRVQHFTSDSVSLSCEGNSTEWRVKRFPEHGYQSHCSDWGRMTGSICSISSLQYTDSLAYWCESGSGEFSNAVNITVRRDGIILVSPANPVAEGQSVTLGCKLRTENVVSNVFFYKNDKLIQNDTRGELNISAVSKSDEGFYKCQWSGQESPQSWMSVKAVSRSESSSFPVLLIVGLVCGISLIILLLLLFCCRKSKDPCCNSLLQSQRNNQSSATDQDENQQPVYSSLLHGDICVYESIRGSGNGGNGGQADTTRNVISQIELKGVGKRRNRDDPGERSDYCNVNPDSATGP